MLEQEGLECIDIGLTYQADHVQQNGNIASSALDHIYCSKVLAQSIEFKKLSNSATDHLPVVAKLEIEQPKNKIFSREVTKRSLKNFTAQRWRETLATKDWESIISCVKSCNTYIYQITNQKICQNYGGIHK